MKNESFPKIVFHNPFKPSLNHSFLMKALILAAGYATRLYPLTENQAKPLLKVGNKTIIEHILEKIKKVDTISQISIITNHRFYPQFVQWGKNYSSPQPIHIIDDGTCTNQDRLGAVGDLHFFLRQEGLDDDLLVIAGDNLFGFSLQEFISFYEKNKKSVVAFHDLKDKNKEKSRYGAGILHGTQVVDFEEKPLDPRSSLASTACYIFTSQDLHLVEQSIQQGQADNTGDLIKYLVCHSTLHGFIFDHYWFDVGSVESLRDAEEVLADEN